MPSRRFLGKVALVTGGGTGIGAAIARAFAADGANVVVMGRRSEPLEQVASEIDGLTVSGDASNEVDARRAVRAACERLGRLDVLVANAGGGPTAAATATDGSMWRAALDANLSSAFVCARESLPALERSTGSIIVVGSVASLVAGPKMAGYIAAKSALLGLVRSLAVDYGSAGVRVNALCPGWVRSPMSDAAMDELAAVKGISREAAFQEVSSNIPLGRVAEPEEIAAVCLFLASEDASFMTGATVIVDGGTTAVSAGMRPWNALPGH
jgi:NAD(P)-dependent dehydrogenase (short-subunit alcohol dehydrogenase family)